MGGCFREFIGVRVELLGPEEHELLVIGDKVLKHFDWRYKTHYNGRHNKTNGWTKDNQAKNSGHWNFFRQQQGRKCRGLALLPWRN